MYFTVHYIKDTAKTGRRGLIGTILGYWFRFGQWRINGEHCGTLDPCIIVVTVDLPVEWTGGMAEESRPNERDP